MENRFYIKELDSYQKASDLSKERMGTNPNYDLDAGRNVGVPAIQR